MQYTGFFINLDSCPSRRQRLEGELAALGVVQRYARFAAVPGASMPQRHETTLSAGQVGCWLSHLAVWREALQAGLHLHILEDDAALSPLLFQVLEQMQLDAAEWDLLFTDVYFHPPPSPEQFAQLRSAREAFLQRRKISLIDLRQLAFTGTTSYLVNRHSLERLESLLAEGWRRNQTIDVVLQQLVREGKLRARLLFPFLSTLSPEHEASTGGMRGPAAAALDAFRLAWFYAADPEAICQRAVPCRCYPNSEPLLELYLNSLRSVLGSIPAIAERAVSP